MSTTDLDIERPEPEQIDDHLTVDQWVVGLEVVYLPGETMQAWLSRTFYDKRLMRRSYHYLRRRFPEVRIWHYQSVHDPRKAKDMAEWRHHQPRVETDRRRADALEAAETG